MTLEQVTTFLRREWRAFVNDAVRPVREPGQPANEARLMETAQRGSEARALLDNPLMLDFLAKAEAQLVTRLTALPIEDDEGRRNLAIAIQTQRQWWRFLAAASQEGRAAEKELERLQRGQAPY